MKKSGFTLIEILIVVAIIGLISTMGLVAFQASMRRTRDARRISEVKALQGAAEQYYADHANSYPNNLDGCFTHLSSYLQGFTVAGSEYVDPKNRAYVCDFTPGLTSYCIETMLEGTTANDGNSWLNCGGTTMSTGVTRYYVLRNLF